MLAAENFAREEKLSPVVIPKVSKEMDEQLKLSHNLVDAVDKANRKNCVILLRYSVKKSEIFFAQNRFFARKTEVEKFQQIVIVNYKLAVFIHLLNRMNSVLDKVITNDPICNVR